MIVMLPTMYHDEIIYSWMSRHVHLTGIVSSRAVNEKFFGQKYMRHFIYYTSNLDRFASRLNPDLSITTDYLIENHSLVPLCKPFMEPEEYNKFKQQLSNGRAKDVSNKLGIDPKSKSSNQIIKYCPSCFLEDRRNDIDFYLRVLHQAPHNLFCNKHKIPLNVYRIPITFRNTHFFNFIDIIKLSKEDNEQTIKHYDKYYRLSKDIESVFHGELEEFDITMIRKKYQDMMKDKGYGLKKTYNRRKLYRDFVEYHGEAWLKDINALIDTDNTFNWISCIYLDKSSKIVDPVKHILFIQFLFGDINSFKNYNYEFEPFGKGPWLCLNPTVKHYNKRVVTELKIRPSIFDRKLMGEFHCECGFIYLRDLPGSTIADEFKYKTVVEYGPVWYKTLKKEILSGKSISSIARIMNVSSNTIVKYADIMGLKEILGSNMKLREKTKREQHGDKLLLERKSIFEKYIHENPGITRNKLRLQFSKEYSYILRKDKKWIELKIPQVNRGKKSSSYWKKLDEELCTKIQSAVERILAYEVPTRITLASIGRELNYLGLNNPSPKMNLNKTIIEANKYTETISEFQVRKKATD